MKARDIHYPTLLAHEIDISVRYYETDAQGHVHHSVYLRWFELGRVEMLQTAGIDYAELERNGLNLVIAETRCRHHRPCRFGDTVRLRVETEEAKGARIRHRYRLTLAEELIATGETTVAMVNDSGRLQRLPEWLRVPRPEATSPPAG